MEDYGGGVQYGSVPSMEFSDPDLTFASESHPPPPLDADMFDGDLRFPESFADGAGIGLDDAEDLDFDFDFSFDDICIPSDAEDFLVDHPLHSSGEPRVLKSELPKSNGFKVGHGSGLGGCDGSSSNDQSCQREFSGPASSQGSGNSGSGVSEAVSSPPDSGSVPSSPNLAAKSSCVVIGSQNKIKVEDTRKSSVSKRKKEIDRVGGNVEFCRNIRLRRATAVVDNSNSPNSPNGSSSTGDVEEKRKARLMRNRESAQLSRQRKKHYVVELEDKVRAMHSTIQDLNNRISFVVAENATLRQQLSGGGICPPPPPGMYPHPLMPPMAYPWVPCASYAVKSQGSQIPLVPIPRLKPQQSTSTENKAKKTGSKKSEGKSKTKKVASVSVLGLLFFFLLFGGLVPMVQVRYSGDKVVSGSNYINTRFFTHHRGKVLTVNDLVGGNQTSGVGLNNEKYDFRGRGKRSCVEQLVEDKRKEPASRPAPDVSSHLDNSSEPLVASLYVPRNDKLVKIDGNLIIHSVMASEKAMASSRSSGMNSRETGLAIPGKVPSALDFSDARRNKGRHPYVHDNPAEHRRAIASGSADNFEDNVKSSAKADGKLQEWFREGLAGPMLSTGMCTEVFQFDVSQGGIIPASSVPNITAEHSQTTARLKQRRNRRFLHGLPNITLPGSNSSFNITKEHVDVNSQNGSFGGNKSLPSMVVSVLVDPREAVDRDADGIIRPKSLPRIFVVVLLDSVKYVTYSCVLPIKGSSPHLVAN